MELRDYQEKIKNEGLKIIRQHRLLYLSMEVRTGKTLTSLSIAQELGVDNVLFITKKKAISSINDDYDKLCPHNFSLFIINYESMHKLSKIKWDMIILDEAHTLGAFPKPSKRSKQLKDLLKTNYSFVCLLSGTPTPESYSQMYHQVYGIPTNPFKQYTNFYKFCHDYVDVKQRKINGLYINDYSRGKDTILDAMKPYTISYTQKAAGFESEIQEEVLYVPMKPITYQLVKRLKDDLIIEGKSGEVVLADTAVKLMMKLHQLYSGSVKFESGNSMITDTSKAEFIKENFAGKKIGIFYKFKAELEVLKEVYGDKLTTDLKEFEITDKNIALQIVSGREGISLRWADYLVYYNIDFSATSYWQSRDRMTTKDRTFNKAYWVFADKGMEKDIYKAVTKKKDYTLKHFKRDNED